MHGIETDRSEKEFDDLLRELISDWFEAEGARLMEEAERLSRDPTAALPEDLERRMLELISQQFRTPQHGFNQTSE